MHIFHKWCKWTYVCELLDVSGRIRGALFYRACTKCGEPQYSRKYF